MGKILKYFDPARYRVSSWLYLRMLALVYFFAFMSLYPQIRGLIGGEGILPAAEFLDLITQSQGEGLGKYFQFPSLVWLNPLDYFMEYLCLGGMLASVFLFFNWFKVPALISLYVLYLSFMSVGREFLNFQWDAFLMETGFLSIFLFGFNPSFRKKEEILRLSPFFLFLLRFLLFRLMFSSGLVKLTSGDEAWRNLTALSFHYEGQPLPTPLSWYVHQLPPFFHKFSTFMVFIIELVVPFGIWGPSKIRNLSGFILIAFQVIILLTGNYTFFNLLTIAVSLMVIDDDAWRKISALWEKYLPRTEVLPGKIGRPFVFFILFFLQLISFKRVLLPQMEIPDWTFNLLERTYPFHLSSMYGLFAVMTQGRKEIAIEGTDDGVSWGAYHFKYKPNSPQSPLAWVAPHQPRLDWQLWFAALGKCKDNQWFHRFLGRLLEARPPVLSLLKAIPPGGTPKYLRTTLHEYRMTNFEEKNVGRGWWKAQLLGEYCPLVKIKK